MQTNNKVQELELNIQGFKLYPTLIWDEEMAILVDTGVPGLWEQTKLLMSQVGVPFERLKAVILTHQDLDHIGSLPEIRNQLGNEVKVYAHELDAPYIEGELHLFKTDPKHLSEAEWAAIPDQMKPLYNNPPKSKVDSFLRDGEILPYCGGIKVIHTPGHTDGHISLYIEDSKTLIAGDSMVAAEGKLHGPIPQTTPDMKTALDSLKKYADLDIQKVICYHGGVYQLDNVQTIAEIVEGLQSTTVK